MGGLSIEVDLLTVWGVGIEVNLLTLSRCIQAFRLLFVVLLSLRSIATLLIPPQGFVLGQYALLWAQQNPDKVDRLLVLNTPLAKSSKLRPELAAYKAPLPFMRPGSVSHGHGEFYW